MNVRGGGLTGQADAIKQGAARALCELSADNRKPLKTEGHLSRDPRAKERRKYGLKKARSSSVLQALIPVMPSPTFIPPGTPMPR